jgi:hypothetical protein
MHEVLMRYFTSSVRTLEVDRTLFAALDLQPDRFTARRNVSYNVNHKRRNLGRLLLMGAQSGPP